MSFRNIQQNSVQNSDIFNINAQQSADINEYANGQWFRNPTWPALPNIISTDERLVGICAVYPNGSNFLTFNTSVNGGTYTVDWGDGTSPQTYTSGTQANYNYDYNAAGLANTNGPVTFTASTSIVNRTNHGYKNNMPISFDSITTTTGIVAGEIYYVINVTTDAFQLAATVEGTPLTLTNDGSGIILPYKIAIVQMYPTTTTISSFSITPRHTSATQNYFSGWLDIAVASSATTMSFGSTSNSIQLYLEQIAILRHRQSSLAGIMQYCYGLQNIVEITAAAGITVTNMSTAFANCNKLKTIPLINTATVTSMASMFDSSPRLISIPLLNTSNVTSMASMFSFCSSLQTIPLIDTSKVTTMANMFQSCFSLRNIPSLNTSNVTSMASMFVTSRALKTIPHLNTINVTIMSGMFSNCSNLETLPLIDTSNVTTMANMFDTCISLKYIPQLNTSKVTNMFRMFDGCSSLTNIPILNTGNVANLQNTFANCSSLLNGPQWNTSKVTDMNSTFNQCFALTSIPLYDTSNVTNMMQMFRSTSTIKSIPKLNTSKVTDVNNIFANSGIQQVPALDLSSVSPSTNMSSIFATTRVKRIEITNTYYSWFSASTNLAAAQLDELYTNLPTVFAQGTAVTFDATAETVTLNDHGFAAGRTVSFASITTTTGISININYFVINPTTNAFQLSSSRGGSAINLTNNGSGTLNGQTITVTGNWGTTTDTPSIATAKGWTVTGS